MGRIGNNNQDLKNLIDLLTKLFEQSNYTNSKAVNSSISSINNFSQPKNNRLALTDTEVSDLKEVLTELEQTEETIEPQLETLNQKNDQLQDRKKTGSEELENLKTNLKEELKPELKEELEAEVEEKINKQGLTFKESLTKYSDNYEAIKVTLSSGDKIKGVLCQVKVDFISLLDKNNKFIKIPINKILAVKKIDRIKENSESEPQTKETKETTKVAHRQEKEVRLPAPEELLSRELVPVKNKDKNS
jgi:hypothetical protein